MDIKVGQMDPKNDTTIRKIVKIPGSRSIPPKLRGTLQPVSNEGLKGMTDSKLVKENTTYAKTLFNFSCKYLESESSL